MASIDIDVEIYYTTVESGEKLCFTHAIRRIIRTNEFIHQVISTDRNDIIYCVDCGENKERRQKWVDIRNTKIQFRIVFHDGEFYYQFWEKRDTKEEMLMEDVNYDDLLFRIRRVFNLPLLGADDNPPDYMEI